MTKREIAGLVTYGVSDVARELGVSTRTVRAWIKKGTLPARKVGREYLITELALRLFITGEDEGEPVGFKQSDIKW